MRNNLIILTFILLTNMYFTSLKSQKNTISQKNESEIIVKIETTKGIITIKLYNETPLHRDNFIKLVEDKYYEGLLFHRVINSFMIQGGDPDSRNAKQGQMLGNGGPNYTIPAEFNKQLIHKKGALAAARTADQINPEKSSSGSQFYIVQGNVYNDSQLQHFESQYNKQYSDKQKEIYKTLGGTPHLDGAYTVFGEVVTGLDVIDKIAAVKTDASNRPLEDVKIISMNILK